MAKKKGSKVKAAPHAGAKGKAKVMPAAAKRGKAPKASSEPVATAADAIGRRRWKDLSVDALQALYAEKVGRPTDSVERRYLIWKIREAEAGRIPVGPRKSQIQGPKVAVTILFGEEALKGIDQAGKRDGFAQRLPYLRTLLREGLRARGHAEVAEPIAG